MSKYDGMSRSELERLYSQATRNFSIKQRRSLERNAAPSAADSPHVAEVKALYRALGVHHTGGAARWEDGQLNVRV